MRVQTAVVPLLQKRQKKTSLATLALIDTPMNHGEGKKLRPGVAKSHPAFMASTTRRILADITATTRMNTKQGNKKLLLTAGAMAKICQSIITRTLIAPVAAPIMSQVDGKKLLTDAAIQFLMKETPRHQNLL
jgi:hypothetical protein